MHDVRGPGQLGGAEPAGLPTHPVQLVGSVGLQQPALLGVRDGVNNDQVAQPRQQVGEEAAGVVPRFDDPARYREQGGAVAGGERVDRLVEQRGVGHAQQRGSALVADTLAAGAGQQLVQDRQGVAYRPGAGPHDEGQHSRVDVDPFPDADRLQVAPQRPGGDEPERIVVRPGADRGDDLVGLSGGEDELQVRRRLLDHLEQGVEALPGHHVGLVHHVDLVARRGGREVGTLAQVTGVLDAAVRRCVDLDDVEGRAEPDRHAVLALAARIRCRALHAVQGRGQDARARRLSAAARAAEQVGVVDTPGAQRLPERIGHMLLADDFGERPRPVAVVEGHEPSLPSNGACHATSDRAAWMHWQ